MREKTTRPTNSKEMNILNLKLDHFRINSEEKFIFQKMRELFKQLRGLPSEERKDSLMTLSLIMNSIYKNKRGEKSYLQKQLKRGLENSQIPQVLLLIHLFPMPLEIGRE